VVRTDSPVAREELERLVHEYRRLREEHRRAQRGSRTRRRLGARLRELELRFEQLLAIVPLDDAARRRWRDHLRHDAPEPDQPPESEPLRLEQGASVHVPPRRRETDVSVHVRGLSARARLDLENTLAALEHVAPRPLLHARGSLERLRDRALERPVVAKAELDLGVRAVRAHAAAATAAEAVDLLEARLRRSLRELADRSVTARRDEAPTPRPTFADRPAVERRLVRRKSFAAGPVTPEEALWEMRLLDHDFHLFTDATAGEDSLVYVREDGTLGLKRIAGGGVYVQPFLIDPEPAPTLDVEAAIALLNATDERLLFFVDRETGRSAALYRRYDGDYGLITTRESVPGALELACAQCGRVLPDDAQEVARWRHGYLALAGELDEVSAAMLLCPECADEVTEERYDSGGGD
jgi:hypothetical protein